MTKIASDNLDAITNLLFDNALYFEYIPALRTLYGNYEFNDTESLPEDRHVKCEGEIIFRFLQDGKVICRFTPNMIEIQEKE